MSEYKKRLTDDEWARKWGCSMPNRKDAVMVALRDDHLQAREDVKRLVDLARAFMFEGRNEVTLKWAKALLAEVES